MPSDRLDFEEKFEAVWPAIRTAELTVLLGVSGGADSVALLSAMDRLCHPTTRLVVAHYNHRLRGEESDQDALFVEALAASKQRMFVTNSIEDGCSSCTDEARLREDRYRFLESQAKRLGARYLLTAHTADDQIETLLFRIFRGTGLTGLAGIAPIRSSNSHEDLVIGRPLLSFQRIEVEAYLRELHQNYRTDSSNASLDYSRNWIRNELIPLLESKFGKRVRQSLLQLQNGASDHVQWMEEVLQRNDFDELQSDHTLRVPRSSLRSIGWPLAQHWLRQKFLEMDWPLGELTRQQWLDISQFLLVEQSNSRIMPSMLPGGIRVELDKQWLVFRKIAKS